MRIREVLVHRHGLVRPCRHDRQVDRRRIDRYRARSGRAEFPVIVDVAESRLVGGEGGSIFVWSRTAIDDGCGVTVERVGGGVEGFLETGSETRSGDVEGGSFEAGW